MPAPRGRGARPLADDVAERAARQPTRSVRARACSRAPRGADLSGPVKGSDVARLPRAILRRVPNTPGPPGAPSLRACATAPPHPMPTTLRSRVSLLCLVTALVAARGAARDRVVQRDHARPALDPRAAAAAADEGGAGREVRARRGGRAVPVGRRVARERVRLLGPRRWAYLRVGVELPHNSYALYGEGKRVAASRMAPGDILFFEGLGHVGLYIGRGRMVHAPETEETSRWSGSADRTTARASSAPAASSPPDASASLRFVTKKRLDVVLVERGLAESRSQAQALVLAGRVRGHTKPGEQVADDVDLSVEHHRASSRAEARSSPMRSVRSTSPGRT